MRMLKGPCAGIEGPCIPEMSILTIPAPAIDENILSYRDV